MSGCDEAADVDDHEPAVSGPIEARTDSTSTAIVVGSQSTKRGLAPAATTAAAVAKNVLAERVPLCPAPRAPQGDLDGTGARVHGDGVGGTVVAANRSSSSRPIAPRVSWPRERLVDATQISARSSGGKTT